MGVPVGGVKLNVIVVSVELMYCRFRGTFNLLYGASRLIVDNVEKAIIIYIVILYIFTHLNISRATLPMNAFHNTTFTDTLRQVTYVRYFLQEMHFILYPLSLATNN